MPRILIIEDHKELAENLFEYLSAARYELDYAADGLTALHLLATNFYDVILLDIMLPGVDGLSICKRIREDLQSSVPIILLTARDSIEDKEQGFTNGADDYLVKPFHMRELELRVQIQCKRRRDDSQIDFLTAKNIRYYPGTLTVTYQHETEVVLTGYAATIFELLIRKYPSFVSYEHLSTILWGEPDGSQHSMRTHVYSLRKILKDHFGQELIATRHGRGYCLEPI
jgi:DNA-binding response OmpR family regulator